MKRMFFLVCLTITGLAFSADQSDTGLSQEEILRRRWAEVARIADYNRRYEDAQAQAEALRVGEKYRDSFEACSASLGQQKGVDAPLQKEYEKACKSDAARRATTKSQSRMDRLEESRRRLW